MYNVWDEIREEGRSIGMQEGRSIGMQEGRNIGMQEGRSIGMQEGRNIGLQEGDLEGRRKIARRMLRDRRFSLEDVSKFSGLSVKELQSLER